MPGLFEGIIKESGKVIAFQIEVSMMSLLHDIGSIISSSEAFMYRNALDVHFVYLKILANISSGTHAHLLEAKFIYKLPAMHVMCSCL